VVHAREHIERAKQVMGGIDLDPASCEMAQKTVQAGKYYTAEQNGLLQPWEGRVWLNPPYAQPHIVNFTAKLIASYDSGDVTDAIALTGNFTDTAWFHAPRRSRRPNLLYPRPHQIPFPYQRSAGASARFSLLLLRQ
jgi:hypothetical protein